ncbi:MAG: cryptochrome/photolyase family protein [Chthoniobacterales bacterium]
MDAIASGSLYTSDVNYPPAPILFLFRRDLRLSDNTAWHHALLAAQKYSTPLIPIYLLSNWKKHHPWTGPHRQAFLCEALASLDTSLRKLNSRLIFRQIRENPITTLLAFAKETGAKNIYLNRLYDPYSQSIETRLKKEASSLGMAVFTFKDRVLHEAAEVLTGTNTPYRKFTPYARTWLQIPIDSPLKNPNHPITTPLKIKSLPIPNLAYWGLRPLPLGTLRANETSAQKRLKNFLQKHLENYENLRDRPAANANSRLSQDLNFGLLSPRQIYSALQKLPPTYAEKFLNELTWREFYIQLLHHFPEILKKEFITKYRRIKWRTKTNAAEDFQCWADGRTGFPIVDAGMRQLRETGHMHNRVRMITAMFLTKDLQIDWRCGEQFFMQHLIDGDIAANNGGWQWSASTGADAAPYFRIQNPWTQSKRHDPQASYIKQWLPELQKLPASLLQKPPIDGKPLASDYPAPIVDHAEARQKTLELFSV